MIIDRLLHLLGTHYYAFLSVLIALALAMGASCFWFIYEHDRFPHGIGEVLNWLFGL